MQEIWKDIEGYDGKYQVSNLGRIKTYARGVEKIRKQQKHSENLGYKHIALCQDAKYKNLLVHRLVAKAFIPNPHNYPVVNHIDSDPSNNIVSNLEWCTDKQNVAHCIKMGRQNFQLNKGQRRHNEKMVINLWSGVYYDNIREAAKAADIPETTLAYRLKKNTSQYQIV